MRYQSHALIAVASVTVFHPWSAGILAMGVTYVFALIGGLLPDIDHPKSFVGSKVPVIPTILYRFSGHRGVTHSLLALGVVSLFGFFCAAVIGSMGNLLVAWSMGIGYASHLLADFITNRGIPAAWPVKRRFVIPITTTGAPLEAAIAVAAFLGCLFLSVPWTEIVPNIRHLLGH